MTSSADASVARSGPRLGGRKVAAWVALVALVFIVYRVVALVVALAFTDEIEVLGIAVDVGLLGLGAWWLLTGRKAKARIGLALVVFAVISLAVTVIGIILVAPRQVVGLVAWVMVFGFFSGRALDAPSRYRRWREGRVALAPGADRPSEPLGRVAVPCGLIVNERSGGGKAEQVELARWARQMGVTVRVLGPGDDLVELAEELVADGAEVLGMAGGDGSLGLVASVAIRHDLPFVCIPVGTRNHFARDLGLDRSDPLAALAAFGGHELVVDTATVNGRTFLNNASFGVYADMVHDPEYRDAKLETAQATIADLVNGERAPSPLHFSTPEGDELESAFMIMVSVGPYHFDTIGDLGVRSSLDSGELQISVLEPADGGGLRRLTTAALLGTLEHADGFWQWSATRFEVSSPRGEVNVGVDGEALTVDSPVVIELRPGSLRVLLPAGVDPVPGPQSQTLGVTVSDLWKLASSGPDA